jgi:hypothetical protein
MYERSVSQYANSVLHSSIEERDMEGCELAISLCHELISHTQIALKAIKDSYEQPCTILVLNVTVV